MGFYLLLACEGLIPTQAEVRIVRDSTLGRKNMTIKTTFRRISLVAVPALGFGMVALLHHQEESHSIREKKYWSLMPLSSLKISFVSLKTLNYQYAK